MSTPSRPNPGTDPDHKQSNYSSWTGLLADPKSVLRGSIVILTIVVLGAYVIPSMLRGTQESSERARVTVQGATIVGPLIQHNIPRATVLLKNTGRSPTLETRTRLEMIVWTSDMSPDRPPKLIAQEERVGELEPGSVVSQSVALSPPLTDVQGMHLERKDWFMVTHGVVSYSDIYGNSHETNLCLIWRDTSTGKMSFCEKWNDAD